ncbi:MAG: trypsin-like peptidase domain-containing protein [Acidobacteria bacterium]|nr:trypsin-like peptidase domain-containing protein [Acidobacteriota bacterium]
MTRFAPGVTVCPRCRRKSPVQLAGGAVCAECEAEAAWDRAGEKLVVTRADIEAAERAAKRQARPADPRSGWRLGLLATAWGAAVLAAVEIVRFYRPLPIGPIDDILGALTGHARMTAAWGGLAALAAAALLLWANRDWRPRRAWTLLLHWAPLPAGLGLAILGLTFWNGYGGALGWSFTTVPPLPAEGDPGHVRLAKRATAVILSPDEHGDARDFSLGSGVVVAAVNGRAWIVTCSHVAIPWITAAARRDPRSVPPAWVILSDGRQGPGFVRWAAPPPIDLAAVEFPVQDPPPPVPFSRDTDLLVAGSPVFFIPNPMRSGWLSRSGLVLKREPHRLPSGGVCTLLRASLPANPGDSGGGLYDVDGRLVGINTWAAAGRDGSFECISLPTEMMEAILSALEKGDPAAIDEFLRKGAVP